MLFSNISEKGNIKFLESNTKDEVFEELTSFLAEKYELFEHYDQLIDSIRNREMECNTQVKDGLAIPHARLDDIIDSIIGVIGISKEGIDWESDKEKNVNVVILIFTPKACANEFLYLMAEIANIFEKTDCLSELLKADSIDEIKNIIIKYENLAI